MARPIYLWLPALTVLALSGCGGTETGLFSDVGGAGAGGSSHAGAASHAGSSASSGSPGSSGSANSPGAGYAGEGTAGQGSAGAPSAGASFGGASSGGSNGGGGTVGGHAGTGAGGSAGSAGHAGAHAGSAGIAGGPPGMTCSDLLQQASQQLEAARACNVAADSLQCTGKVTNLCSCDVPVQRSDSPETKAYLKTLKLLQDQKCEATCTAIACVSVGSAQCRASNASTMGSCVAASHGPTP